MTPALAHDGALGELAPAARKALLDRRASFEPAIEAVRGIRDDVRERGDAALLALTEKFDGATLERLEVSREECDAALARLPADAQKALAQAAENVWRFHASLIRPTHEIEVAPGLRAGRRYVPYRRAGVYVPGGRAAYPSTVIMTVVPAKVAGVREVVVCTPPGRDGKVPDATLAACALAGADRVFAVGGAQAVFAMAFGTESVPRVDKVVGPGNAYVAAAKAMVAGDVAIDSPAGPSEVLVLHLGSAAGERARDATFAAAEMLAQAEHGPDSCCVLVTTDPAFAAEARAALDAGLATAPRRDVIERSLAANGAVLVAGADGEAVAFADAYAPEHLVVLAPEPRAVLDLVANYGSAFLGPWSTVALGDYCAGPNHVLPTAGLARAYSGLSTDDFLKRPTHTVADPQALKALGAITRRLAHLEGLPAHAAAVDVRVEALAADARRKKKEGQRG